jgi:hypothetical protein
MPPSNVLITRLPDFLRWKAHQSKSCRRSPSQAKLVVFNVPLEGVRGATASSANTGGARRSMRASIAHHPHRRPRSTQHCNHRVVCSYNDDAQKACARGAEPGRLLHRHQGARSPRPHRLRQADQRRVGRRQLPSTWTFAHQHHPGQHNAEAISSLAGVPRFRPMAVRPGTAQLALPDANACDPAPRSARVSPDPFGGSQ